MLAAPRSHGGMLKFKGQGIGCMPSLLKTVFSMQSNHFLRKKVYLAGVYIQGKWKSTMLVSKNQS